MYKIHPVTAVDGEGPWPGQENKSSSGQTQALRGQSWDRLVLGLSCHRAPGRDQAGVEPMAKLGLGRLGPGAPC